MRHKVKGRTEDYAEGVPCRHHWIIETARGPKSRGVCKYCGEVRDFLNSMPDSNVLKRNANPLNLPKMPKVKLDKDSQS